jgi:hypothetical protein
MYKVVKRAISKELAEFCYDYFCNKRKVVRVLFDAGYISQFNYDWGQWKDEQVRDTYCHYSDLVMETLLQKLKYRVEIETELKLNETYSYARIYKKGDVLERHKDRYSCEVSTSLHLGGDQWPIFLEPSGKEEEEGLSVLLDQGDMLIYQGCELEHWREAFEGENCGQVFLHYNDASKAELSKYKYDGRPFLGLPADFKIYRINK